MSKVSFDIVTRIITITIPPVLENGDLVIDIDVQEDLYSQGKIDWVADSNLRKLLFPIRAVGGDDLPGSKKLGDTYFLAADWKIAPFENSHRLRVNGNFYSEDGTSPFNNTVGNYNLFLEQTVSSLVDSTVQQLEEIEFATFNGGVTIDEVNGTLDLLTGLPGSPANPVKLLADANAIIIQRMLPKKVFVVGNLTINDAVSWVGYEFEGESPLKSTITILDAAIVMNCEFYQATITGILDGNSQIENAVISNLDFVDGYIFNCALGPNPIILGTSTNANIFASFSTTPGTLTPTIDMNGTGILALRDYNGGILLRNYNGSDSHSVDLSSGQVKLDTATITSGTFVVRGVGKLVDELGNVIPTGMWNGGVTIINETNSYLMSVSGGGATAAQVWEYPVASLSGSKTTMGYWVSRKLLTLSRWLANKKRD